MPDIVSRPYDKEGEETHERVFGKRSWCCNAKAVVEGNTTKFYVCTKCGKPCDTK